MTILPDLPPVRDMPALRADARRRELEELLSRTSSQPTLRRRTLLTAGAVCAAGVAAAVLAAINPWARTPAYAAWTAVPTRLDVPTTQQMAARCADHLQPAFDSLSGWVTAVGEQRGRVRAVLLVGQSDGQTRWGLCAPGLGVDGLVSALPPPVGNGSPPPTGVAVPPAPRGAAPVVYTFFAGTARIALGRVAAGVTRVLIVTDDARVVTATVGHGYCLAWWPSLAGIHAVDEFTATGQEFHPLNYPAK